MDKKDIYDHLAKIYLDASSKRKNKGKRYFEFKKLFFSSAIVIFGLSIILFAVLNKINTRHSEIALVLQPDVVKINFHFDPAKKEIYSINLDKLNLSKFKTLAFSVKKADYNDNIALRVEFANVFKESSEIYLKDIAHKWQEHKIALSNFKKLSDWSKISELSFIVEDWNTNKKRGLVYIDNVRFLR